MKHFCKSGGFTLVEMVVCIAIASLVTMAATTVLMLALRVNRQTSDTASQQNTVRALLTTLEKAATDGNIDKFVANLDSWQLFKDDETQPIFEYVAFDQKILANGITVLEGVFASNVIFDQDSKLLSISVETKEGIFESTVFCRLGKVEGENAVPVIPETPETDINQFLAILMGELNSSGKIQKGTNEGKYYSEWYIGQTYENGVGQGGWNADTPWCACYISWALVEAGMRAPEFDCDNPKHNHENWFADVDEFLSYFGGVDELSQAPQLGDIVFFDWITDDNAENPQHAGVVLKAESDYIITIEGNSAGRVAMRRYASNDPRILGYGILNWAHN